MSYIVSQVLLLKVYVNKFGCFVYIILLLSLLISEKIKQKGVGFFNDFYDGIRTSENEWIVSKNMHVYFIKITF